MKKAHCLELREIAKTIQAPGIGQCAQGTKPTYYTTNLKNLCNAVGRTAFMFGGPAAALPCQHNGQEWSRKEGSRKKTVL